VQATTGWANALTEIVLSAYEKIKLIRPVLLLLLLLLLLSAAVW